MLQSRPPPFPKARDVPSYLEHVASRLSREEARVAHYLHGSSRKPLMAAVRQTLLAVHVRPLLERGFADLVQHARLDDLGRMYSLFAQARVLPLPRRAVRAPHAPSTRAANTRRARGHGGVHGTSTAPPRRVPQVNALPELRQAFAAHIKSVGGAMVSDQERERGLVQERLVGVGVVDLWW